MRILFVSPFPPLPADSGVRMRSWGTLEGLCRRHRVHLLCLRAPHETLPDELFRACETAESFPVSIGDFNRPTLTTAFHAAAHALRPTPYSLVRFDSDALRERLEQLLKTGDYDLLFCDHLSAIGSIPALDIPSVLSEHNVEFQLVERFVRRGKGILRRAYAVLELAKLRRRERWEWRRFDHTIVVSEDDRDIVKRLEPQASVSVVPNAIRVPEPMPDPAGRRPVDLLYTGTMEWYPNHDAALYFTAEILPLVRRSLPEVLWEIVGQNPRAELRAIADQDPRIRVTGRVPSLDPHLAAAKLFIAPIRIGGGTRIKILEAMAHGLPVVSTSIGCEGLGAQSGRNIEIADDPATFAECVVSLLRDDDRRRRLGAEGRAFVAARYSWPLIQDQLCDLVEGIAAGRRSRAERAG